MSADSAVTYTSVHSEARSWSIPSEDPYEEAARQLLEQSTKTIRSPEYVPNPIELEDHVPVYIPEPEHPEDIKFRDTKRRMMTALEMVNMRKDHAAVRAELRALEARVTVLETEKMVPKRATRSTPVTPAPTATTPPCTMRNSGLIDQGIVAAMAKAEASRVRNSYDNNGTEGVVGLTRWFKKIKSVFSISNCTASCQVKFATCTLQDDALTWWNAHVKTTTPEAAYSMPWATLKKLMTNKILLYISPRGDDQDKNCD
ncbi:hypothetical protein Tco_1068892 [Tanacetum coccineum]|uniref:Reverse transcriptase domain-containing protein n=1 Tax=Tanacetum coccineum TaxID=301880 RepID=A0ABQ5HHE0_9ASTR